MPFNGFSLFTKEMRMQLEGYGRSSQSNALLTSQFIRNASHQWEKLSGDEKKMWKERGRDKYRTEEYYAFKRQARPNRRQKERAATAQIRRRNEELKKLDEFDDDDYPEDAMIGTPLNQNDYDGSDDRMSEQSYSKKYAIDKARVLNFLRSLKGIDEIKRTRFLFISAQTYGDFDGICVPAEIAMCEFNLRHGIIDQFNSVVGPWRIDNEIQRRRAEFHARETHRIHLETPVGKAARIATQSSCLREILGRCEPLIAEQQGFSVGLYRGGIREFDTDAANFNASSKQLSICGQMKGTHPLFGADNNGRRWLVCLKHEYDNIRSSLQFLMESQGSRFEGFPTMEDQFVFADALVDALAEHLKGIPNAEYKLWMDIFGKNQPFEFVTPWERRANVFCRVHSATRNCCCAAATAARSCFAIFFALREPLQLPFGD
uniref:HMG box domain-containing protein n=2 Tax=Parascaris univalens TaxID=6257 RepID=A0A914ZG21_PARUN